MDSDGFEDAPFASGHLQTVGAYLVDRLYEVGGVRYLFGIPGGAINGFHKAVRDDGRLVQILNAHETGAAFAAYGYARAAGGVGALAVTSGPGATNAITGVAAAHCDSVPIVVLSAQSAVSGRNGAQDSSRFGVDTVAMLDRVTRMSTTLDDPSQACDMIDRALWSASTGRGGPVHLSLSPMVSFLPAQHTTPRATTPTMRAVDVEAIEQAAALIADAERVVVIAGHGVERSGACEALRTLAEDHALAVANTPQGRVFSERHPLSLGVFGMGGHRRADDFVDQAEVVVVVGSGMGEIVNGLAPLTPTRGLVRVDVDPMALRVNMDPDVAVLGDARAALMMMCDALHRLPRRRDAAQVAAHIGTLEQDPPAPMDHDGDGIHPSTLVSLLADAVPRDTILVPDIGNSTGQVIHHWKAEPGCYFSAWGLASMACAIGISTGVRLARPHQTVVAVVGDGAFVMNPGELHTQAEYHIKVITVVVNDGGHGMVDHFDQMFFGESASPARFRQRVDACAVAEGLGVRGLRARTTQEFRDAVEIALRHPGPVVIDAVVDPVPMTPISPRFMPRTAVSDGHDEEV